MKTGRSLGDKIFGCVNALILFILMIIMLYPMLYVLMGSLSDANTLMKFDKILYKPAGFSLDAYNVVFSNPKLLNGYKNTLFIIATGVTINLIMTSLGAYVLSSKDVYWNKLFTVTIIITMFFNVGMIPKFLSIKQLGLDDSLWAVILPFCINTFNLIIMRTSFEAVPVSLKESAELDGANDFHILFRIVLPLSMPVVSVMILYYGVFHWNSWLYASMLIRQRSLMPLQIILREILLQNSTDSMVDAAKYEGGSANIADTVKYATIIVATVPILCVYPFLQKYFAKGAMIGAVKG